MAAAETQSGIEVLMGSAVPPRAWLRRLRGQVPRRRHAGQVLLRNDEERRAAAEEGQAPGRVYATDDLCSGDNIFFAATGITGGDLLRGVRYEGPYADTHSMVLRSATGTMRFVDAFHEAAKLRARGVLGVQLDWKR